MEELRERWIEELFILNPMESRRDLKRQEGSIAPSALRRRELEQLGASLQVSKDITNRTSGLMDHIALSTFRLTANPNRVFLLGGTLLVRVVANTINGASVLDAKEGFVRKRVLLFNDILLICKAHNPTVDANGIEEYDDTSVGGTNELELMLNLNEMNLNLMVFPDLATNNDGGLTKVDVGDRGSVEVDKQGSRHGAPSHQRSSSNRSLIFEIAEYKANTKREVRLHLKTAKMDSCDRWVEELESMLLLNRLGSKVTERPGWYYTLIKDGFYAAAYNGDLKTLKRYLIEEWTSLGEINRQDEAGMTALMWAALGGHAMTCRLLLEHGADPEIKQTQGGNTAMHLAAGKGHVDIVRSLLAFGAHHSHRNHLKSTPLQLALLYSGGMTVDDERSKRMQKVVHLLYSQGASVLEKLSDGSTLLDLCISWQLVPSVDTLLKLGAQANCVNPVSGFTPLQAVCATAQCGNQGYEMMRLLVGRGCHVNRKADPVSIGKALSNAMMGQFSPSHTRPTDPRANATPLSILCSRYEAAIRRERKEGIIEGLAPATGTEKAGRGSQRPSVGCGKENKTINSNNSNGQNDAHKSTSTTAPAQGDPLAAIRLAVDKERAQLRQDVGSGSKPYSSSSDKRTRVPLAAVSPDAHSLRSSQRSYATPASTSARLGAGLALHRSSFKGNNDYNSSVTTPIYTGAGIINPAQRSVPAVVSPEEAPNNPTDSTFSSSSYGGGREEESVSGAVVVGVDAMKKPTGSTSSDIFRCILELTRVGARWAPEDATLITRPTMRNSIKDARQRWSYLQEPPDFLEYVDGKQRDGEILFALKSCWQNDAQAPSCALCGDAFSSFSLRKHHCRACGVIVCDHCSSKRLQLAVMPPEHDQQGLPMSQLELAEEFSRGRRESFMTPRSTATSATSGGPGRGTMVSAAGSVSPGQSKKERCCDSCFVRLVTCALERAANRASSSAGATSDRHAIRQMRASAKETIGELRVLVRALDGQLAMPSTRGRERRTRELEHGTNEGDSSGADHDSDSPGDSDEEDDDGGSTSTRSIRDSLDERDPTSLVSPGADIDYSRQSRSSSRREDARDRDRHTEGIRPSLSERLSSVVMVATGCSTAGVASDGVYRTPGLKLSLVHDDDNFRRSIRSNARLIAQTKRLLQAEKATMSFLDSAKVFQREIGVVVDHE